MNERIKKLISDSYVEVPHERDWDATSSTFDKEKFAKLIVEEFTAQIKLDLDKWLKAQVYSGSSHTTRDMGYTTQPDWLSAEELTEYMPAALDEIAKKFIK